MSSFTPRVAVLPTAPADPQRRVHYARGLVLGVDEFNQEFAYLAGRDRWLARELGGYGTVSGLRVAVVSADSGGPRLAVSAGTAIGPGGRVIKVATGQQASIDEWLDVNRLEMARRVDFEIGSPPSASVPLHLVLCYRERLTGYQPAPGEPCRSEDVEQIPSRVADDFTLDLRFDEPRDREEDAVRQFGGLLRQIEFSPASSATVDEFVDALRAAAFAIESPPGSLPRLLAGSPPGPVRVSSADACEYFHAALRLWVTELRPAVRGPAQDHVACAAPASADEDCVYLATVHVPVTFRDGGWRADTSTPVAVDESRRPVVAHAGLLQEWLSCASRDLATSGGVVAAGRIRGAAALSSRNGLAAVAEAPAAGRVKLSFIGYRQPAAGSDYIVKVLPSRRAGAADAVIVDFGGFEADGFVLLVTDFEGTPLPPDALAGVELQVEVSRL